MRRRTVPKLPAALLAASTAIAFGAVAAPASAAAPSPGACWPPPM